MKAIPASSTRCLTAPPLPGQVHAGGAVDGLAGVAGRQDRQGPIPLRGEDQHGVHVFALGQGAEAVDGRGAELGGRLLGPMRHLVADRPHLEPIGQHPQGRGVPLMPDLAQADNTDAKLHCRLSGYEERIVRDS